MDKQDNRNHRVKAVSQLMLSQMNVNGAGESQKLALCMMRNG